MHLLSAGDARGERAAILLYSGTEVIESPEGLRGAVVQALGADDIEVVDAFARARLAIEAGAAQAMDLASFARARELLDEGWRSYLEGRPSLADTRLVQARTEVLAVAHLQGGHELLAEVLLRLGVTKLDLQRVSEAADDFRLGHALAPDRVVSDSEFKPEVVLAYQAAVSQERAWQERPLEVSPPDAPLWIDGKSVAKTSLLRLQDGLHLLSATRAGFRGSSQLVSVSAGGPASLRIDLAVDPVTTRVLQGERSLARGVAEADARQAAGAVLLYGQVDAILLVASIWHRDQYALLGQRCAEQPVQCSRVVEVGYPEGGLLVAVGELWRTLKDADKRFSPILQNDARLQWPARRVVKDAAATPHWLANRWLWIGVAAATVTGGAIYLLSGDTELRPVFVGDTCSFGGC